MDSKVSTPTKVPQALSDRLSNLFPEMRTKALTGTRIFCLLLRKKLVASSLTSPSAQLMDSYSINHRPGIKGGIKTWDSWGVTRKALIIKVGTDVTSKAIQDATSKVAFRVADLATSLDLAPAYNDKPDEPQPHMVANTLAPYTSFKEGLSYVVERWGGGTPELPDYGLTFLCNEYDIIATDFNYDKEVIEDTLEFVEKMHLAASFMANPKKAPKLIMSPISLAL